jgi:hypothetical protein
MKRTCRTTPRTFISLLSVFLSQNKRVLDKSDCGDGWRQVFDILGTATMDRKRFSMGPMENSYRQKLAESTQSMY